MVQVCVGVFLSGLPMNTLYKLIFFSGICIVLMTCTTLAPCIHGYLKSISCSYEVSYFLQMQNL